MGRATIFFRGNRPVCRTAVHRAHEVLLLPVQLDKTAGESLSLFGIPPVDDHDQQGVAPLPGENEGADPVELQHGVQDRGEQRGDGELPHRPQPGQYRLPAGFGAVGFAGVQLPECTMMRIPAGHVLHGLRSLLEIGRQQQRFQAGRAGGVDPVGGGQRCGHGRVPVDRVEGVPDPVQQRHGIRIVTPAGKRGSVGWHGDIAGMHRGLPWLRWHGLRSFPHVPPVSNPAAATVAPAATAR